MKHKLKRQGYRGMRFVTTERMLDMATAARKALKKLRVPHINIQEVHFTKFACGEVKPKIMKNVRNKDVFLFFDFNGEPNQDLINFYLTIDALNLAGAESITLVIPYLPYLRQDRKDEPRTPISAAMVIRFMQSWPRVTRVITIDMHSEQLQSVFTIPTDHLPGSVIFAPWAKAEFDGQFDKLVVVAPDFGSAKRARKLAEQIDKSIGVAILEKKRDATGVEILSIIGVDVKGKTCLINDDMMDTCGTIIKAAIALYAQGAAKVILSATHAIFSPTEIPVTTDDPTATAEEIKRGFKISTAYQKLSEANVQVVVTDSLVIEEHDWLTVLPLGNYLAQVILKNITGGSVSTLIREGLSK
jgi:ribose-phosphate pyrophosphokinase